MNDRTLYPPESRHLDARALRALLTEARSLARVTGRSGDWRRVDRLEGEVDAAEQRERRP